MTETATPRVSQTCRFSGPGHDGTCGDHAVITATAFCVHEHVHADVPVCQYHVQEVAAGDSYCHACFLYDGHDCMLLADPRAVRVLEAAHPDVLGDVAHA